MNSTSVRASFGSDGRLVDCASCRVSTRFFFFSSRRRHTRLVSDWSSDVCSSDLIEENQFSPPKVRRLKEKVGDQLFVTRVCRNCDARSSCASYREYALGSNARFEIGRASCRERV